MKSRRSPLLLVMLAVLAVPASAGAVTLVNPDGSRAEPYSAWAEGAKIPTPVRTLTISTDMTLCGSLASQFDACALYGTIVMRQRCEDAASLTVARLCRFVFWHEMGHEFMREMPQWKLDYYAKIMGAKWSDTSVAGPGSYLSEAFADAYALCKYRRVAVYARDTTAGTREQTLTACRLIRQPN